MNLLLEIEQTIEKTVHDFENTEGNYHNVPNIEICDSTENFPRSIDQFIAKNT